MDDKKSLQKSVDEDILYCQEMWKKFAYDADKMEELFNRILFKYISKIDFIDEGLKVISVYEDKIKKAETYRANVETLMERLEVFRNNHYSNEGLMDCYLKADAGFYTNSNLSMNFNEARRAIEDMERLSSREKEEINNKIDDIEEIIQSTDTKGGKWDKLRPYVLWLSGKGLRPAMIIMTLLLKLSDN